MLHTTIKWLHGTPRSQLVNQRIAAITIRTLISQRSRHEIIGYTSRPTRGKIITFLQERVVQAAFFIPRFLMNVALDWTMVLI